MQMLPRVEETLIGGGLHESAYLVEKQVLEIGSLDNSP
jgi:hypothetical protein